MYAMTSPEFPYRKGMGPVISQESGVEDSFETPFGGQAYYFYEETVYLPVA